MEEKLIFKKFAKDNGGGENGATIIQTKTYRPAFL